MSTFLSQAFQSTSAATQASVISAPNSSQDPLPDPTGSTSFEGAWVSGANYSVLQCALVSDTACILEIVQSFEPAIGVGNVNPFVFTYTNGMITTLQTVFYPITCPFVKVYVTNLETGNTVFLLSTKFTSSGSVSISNFPAVQQVSGSVTVSGSIVIPYLNETTDSVAVFGSDGTNNFPIPLTTGGQEIAMSITDPLPAGTAHIGEVSISNLPAVQDISGTVTVANITDPLPAGTNKVGTVGLSGLWNDGAIDTEVQATMVKFQNNFGGEGDSVAVVTTMDAIFGKASISMYAISDGQGGFTEQPVPLSTRYIPSSQDPLTNQIQSLHTWVDNFPAPPAVQDISGTVTVASITAPLPAGTNTMGAVKIEGVYDAVGGSIVPMYPSTYPLTGVNLGENAVALVTTTDAKGGNASTAICGKSLQTGNIENINCIESGTSEEAGQLHSLQTWVVNHPDVQVVAGRETPYIGFATPATNIPAVYADGIPGVNVTGGWSYINTLVGVPPYTGSRNKINWYVYNSATPDTDFTVSQISSAYMVINQKSTLGTQAELPWITIYTRPDSGVNNGGTFYKNALLFGGFSFIGTTGMMLLYTGEDPVGIHPEITGANRYKLEFNAGASTTTLAAASGEGAYLASIQTDSTPAADGTRNFVFSEFSMMWEQSAIPLPISQSQVQVFDKALNASAATLVTDLSGITITANKLQVGGTVAVSNFPATQPVSGSVSVSNLPATQPVSGSVSVSNFPATQPVSGTFWQATQPVSGTFWQATQPVSGTVAISNFPEGGSNVTIVSALPAGTNAIGSVTVSNFPEGGSEVSVVSALPTGSNVIGGVNINTNNNSQVTYAGFAPQFTDSYSGDINITPYRSVDILVQAYNVYNADTQDGITLNVQVSPNTNDWFTLPGNSLNFKGQNPPSLALNDVKTNSPYIRLIALNANNPSSMTMGSTITLMAKY